MGDTHLTRNYEHIEHTADLALRIHGRDLEELFANAAHAMFSELVDLRLVAPNVRRSVHVDGTDHESLLVNWLNQLLFLHETRDEVYSDFDIHDLTSQALWATVRGEHSEDVRMIIKAATYHDLVIQDTGEGYVVPIIFDV